MPNDNVVKLLQPGTFSDRLTEVLRTGARALLAQAVEAEVADFLRLHADLETEDGHRRVVRHGHLPEREVMTGIGPVAVRQPRVRDREAACDDPGRIRFSPTILPPYMRRSKSIETLLPILYLKGISTGDADQFGLELRDRADHGVTVTARVACPALPQPHDVREGQCHHEICGRRPLARPDRVGLSDPLHSVGSVDNHNVCCQLRGGRNEHEVLKCLTRRVGEPLVAAADLLD